MSPAGVRTQGALSISAQHDVTQSGWNEQVEASGGHLLQTWGWGEFKQLHGWTPVRLHVVAGDNQASAQVLYRFQGPVSIGYIPRGPAITGDAEAIWPALIREIDAAGRDHRAIATYIEPDQPLELNGSYRQHGVVQGPGHFQPGRTVKVALGSDEDILARMHQKTRYSVRLAQRRGVVIEQVTPTAENLDTFYALMRDTADRNEFGIHSQDYYRDFMTVFGDRALLLFARVDTGEIGATLMAARSQREGVYMYGASSTEHRSNGAAHALQFEAMKWTRDAGCATYDLWGIPEEDPTAAESHTSNPGGTKGSDWRGLHRFKTGFGGEIVSYPEMLERRHLPVLPWLARKLNVIRG